MTGRISRLCSGLCSPVALSATGALAVAAMVVPPVVNAIDSATLSFHAIDGDGWQARDVEIQLGLGGPGNSGARITVGELALADAAGGLTSLVIDCPDFLLERTSVRCTRATAAGDLPVLGPQRFAVAFAYSPASGGLAIRLSELAIGAGTASLDATLEGGDWMAEIVLAGADLSVLAALARHQDPELPELTVSGAVNMTLRAHGTGSSPRRITWEGGLNALTAANVEGTLATDGLTADLAGELDRLDDGWHFTASLTAASGQAYAEPVFLDFAAAALTGNVSGVLHEDSTIDLAHFRIDHRDILQAQGQAIVAQAETLTIRELDIVIESLKFPGAYTSYLQPFLLATDFRALETAGSLSGRARLVDGQPWDLALDIDQVSADDGTGRLALYGMNGTLAWHAGGSGQSGTPSWLTLEGGVLFGMDLGAARFDFRIHGRDFALLEPVRVPLLDGAIELDRFEVSAAGTTEMAFALDANVLPLSVLRLSRAFGWPEFGGSLAGRISDLRLDNGVLTLATTLEARVFDGRIEVSDLTIEDPFGQWPRLYSSIGIYNLDLEQVTSAFSFGLITGRLSGYVNEIVLFDWSPVEFDLRLSTPPGDRSRRRISQRAVQNIGNLGGGGAGVGTALSSGFMRFFDEFNYDRLGIACRLVNEVCEMDGVEPAPNGAYYLVKGRGVPRIDVIGNARQVDWPRLVAQLAAIAESEGPVVR